MIFHVWPHQTLPAYFNHRVSTQRKFSPATFFVFEENKSDSRVSYLTPQTALSHNYQPGATTHKSDIGPQTAGTFIKWSASVLALTEDIL